jgi:alkylhydroperoxidase family enzyme
MRDCYDRLMRQLQNSVLNTPGATGAQLRQAVASEVAAIVAGHSPSDNGALPEPLRAYVGKVARHAYQVTDDDVAALRRAGYSEDAIFEITASAALAAGLGRLERGLAALKGEV